MKATSSNEIYYYNVLTGVSSWTKPIQESKKDKKQQEIPLSNKEKLETLLAKYSPNNYYYNAKIQAMFHDREYVPIQVIESFLSAIDTPFDERLSAVSKYIQDAVNSFDYEPDDENLNRWRFPKDTAVEKHNSYTPMYSRSSLSDKVVRRNETTDLPSDVQSRDLSKAYQIASKTGRTATFLYR